MMSRLKLILLSLIPVTSIARINSLRGLPCYANVAGINLKRTARSPHHQIEVCYQFATTTPISDYSDLASKVLRGMPITLMPRPTYEVIGDRQETDILFNFVSLVLHFLPVSIASICRFMLPR